MKKPLLIALMLLCIQQVKGQICPAGFPATCTNVTIIPLDPANVRNITTAYSPACVDTPTILSGRLAILSPAIANSRLYVKSKLTVQKLSVSKTGGLRLCCGSTLILDTLSLQTQPNSILPLDTIVSGCIPACIYIKKRLSVELVQFIPLHVRICLAPGATIGLFGTLTGQPITTNCTGCSQALPINITEFSASMISDYRALIKWNAEVTGTSMVDKYIVSRSTDAIHFTDMATLPASARSWIDAPPSGFVYYRLGVKDVNGELTYSQIQKVFNPNKTISSIVVNDVPYLLKNNYSPNMPVSVSVFDMTGKEIIKYSDFNISLTSFANGFYIVRITQQNGLSEVIKVYK